MTRSVGSERVRLLASGTLALAPLRRPLVQKSCKRIGAWRRLNGLCESTELEQAGFVDGRSISLHSGQLREHWRKVLTLSETPILIYLHRGHQPDTRSPILQYLLNMIDHRGPVHALRVESNAALRDAFDVSRGLATQLGLVLVLSDPTERIAAKSRTSAPLRYLLLGDVGRLHGVPDAARTNTPQTSSVRRVQELPIQERA